MHMGDANTEFFHLMANNRRKKIYIKALLRDGTLLTSQQNKLQEAHQHFNEILGTTRVRHNVVHLGQFGLLSF